jgi:hypothetical protein
VAARTGVAAAFDEDGLEDGEPGEDGLALAGGDADALPDKLELGVGGGIDGLLIGWDVMTIVFCDPSTEDSTCGVEALMIE